MCAWRESVLFCLRCGWCLHPSLVCKLWESERMLEDIKYSLLGLCSATWHAQLLLLHSQLHTNSNYLEKKVNSWKNETISGAIVAFCAYLESSRASPWCILEQCCTTSGMDGRLLLMVFWRFQQVCVLRSFTNISVLILLISLPWLWPSGSFPVAPSRICEKETSPRAVDMATVTVWVEWKEASEAGGEEREIGVPDCWHSWIKLPVQSACLSVYGRACTHTRMHTHTHTEAR